MDSTEFYGFLPFIILTELGYLLFAYLHWRHARQQLPGPTRSLIYLLLALQFFLVFMHAWTFGWADIQRQRQWDLNWERNIPATFATMQMALVGSVALLLGLLGKLPLRRRAYVLVLAALFLLFAYDEYLLLHEHIDLIRGLYIGFGLLFVPFSLLSAWQGRRQSAHSAPLYFWAGMGIGIAGFGAFTLEAMSFLCLPQFAALTEVCLRPYPLEEALENLGTLFVLLALLSEVKRAFAPGRLPRLLEASVFILVLYLCALQLAYWFGGARERSAAYALPSAQPVAVEWDDGEDLLLKARGWSVTGEEPAILQPLIRLYLSAGIPLREDFGYSFVLLDAVQQDVLATYDRWQIAERRAWQPQRVIRESSWPWELESLPTNRALLLTLTLWKAGADGEYERLPIRSSDRRQLSETQVVLAEFVLPAPEPATVDEAKGGYRFGESFILRGVELPARALPGALLPITMTWEARQDGEDDWIQFLHFIQEETGALWNQDQEPLGARLPTRLWYAGLSDAETWLVPIPAGLAEGRYKVYTGLYRHRDMARMPIYGGDGQPLPEARLPVGTLVIGAP